MSIDEKPVRLFMAAFGTEVNSFAPIPSGMELFEEVGVFKGDGSRRWHESGGENYVAPILEIWRNRAETEGFDVIESISACAQPAGNLPNVVYEELRDLILDDLKNAGPLDMVLLCLHGAMVANDYEDCEGDILTRIRQMVGKDTVVGVHLDLHLNLTNQMLEQADLLICHKEYPHIDGEERAHDLFDLSVRTVRQEIRPVMRCFETAMIGLFPTTVDPMRSYVDSLMEEESNEGILSVSLAHGFPWSDIADCTAKLWVITDDDAGLAQQTADRLGRKFYALREQVKPAILSFDEVMEKTARILTSDQGKSGPVIWADIADNSGGGAPSDSTFILQDLMKHSIPNAAVGCFWDPVAVDICKNAGVGTTLELRIGGKCGPVSGDPVDLKVTVRQIKSSHSQIAYDEATVPMGEAVWLEADNNMHLVINSTRSQTYSPEAFTGLGLDITALDLVVVKSTQHFHAKFAPLSSAIFYVSTPGAMRSDFENIPYSQCEVDYWPKVFDPLNGDS